MPQGEYEFVIAGRGKAARWSCEGLIHRGVPADDILYVSASKLGGSGTDKEWYDENEVEVVEAESEWTFDSKAKTINIREDFSVAFKKLVIAYDDEWSKGTSRTPVQGEHVYLIDSDNDRRRLEKKVEACKQAGQEPHVVIQICDLDALETAATALKWVCASVTVLNPVETFYPSVLPAEILDYVVTGFKSQGVRFLLSSTVSALADNGLELEDGTELPCDIFLAKDQPVLPLALKGTRSFLDFSGATGIKVDSRWRLCGTDVYFVGKSAAWFSEGCDMHIRCASDDVVASSIEDAIKQMFGDSVDRFNPLLRRELTYFDASPPPLHWHLFGLVTQDLLEFKGEPPSKSFGYFYLKPAETNPNLCRVVGILILLASEAEIEDIELFTSMKPLVEPTLLSTKFVREFAENDRRAEEMNSKSATNPVYMRVGNRTVDIVASLRAAFDKYCQPDGTCILKKDFAAVTREMQLDLTKQELEEALLCFPSEEISYTAFEKWWIS